jgi:hypothetical protein
MGRPAEKEEERLGPALPFFSSVPLCPVTMQ